MVIFAVFFFLVGLYDHCGFVHMKLVHGRWYKNCVIFKLFCLIKTFFYVDVLIIIAFTITLFIILILLSCLSGFASGRD